MSTAGVDGTSSTGGTQETGQTGATEKKQGASLRGYGKDVTAENWEYKGKISGLGKLGKEHPGMEAIVENMAMEMVNKSKRDNERIKKAMREGRR